MTSSRNEMPHPDPNGNVLLFLLAVLVIFIACWKFLEILLEKIKY